MSSPPAAMTDGSSRRSSSAATVLLGPGMPHGFLPLLTLRSRTTVLQHVVPPASQTSPAALRQPSSSAESGRTARSSGPSAKISPMPDAGSRDGSRFTFDHVSGIIQLWIGFCSIGTGFSSVRRCFIDALAGNSARCMAGLPGLRPHRPFHRSVSAHSTPKVRPT